MDGLLARQAYASENVHCRRWPSAIRFHICNKAKSSFLDQGDSRTAAFNKSRHHVQASSTRAPVPRRTNTHHMRSKILTHDYFVAEQLEDWRNIGYAHRLDDPIVTHGSTGSTFMPDMHLVTKGLEYKDMHTFTASVRVLSSCLSDGSPVSPTVVTC